MLASLAFGVFAYTGTYEGAPAGNSTLTVLRSGDGAMIQEKATGTLNGMQLIGNATLSLGADLAPTVYDGSYQSGALNTVVTVSVTPAAATVVANTTGGQPQTFGLTEGAEHFVVIEPGLVAGLFALPAEMQAWKFAPFLAIAPAVGRAEHFDLDTTAKPQRPPDVPAQDEELSFGGPFAFTIWYDPKSLVPDEVVVPSQSLVVTRVRS